LVCVLAHVFKFFSIWKFCHFLTAVVETMLGSIILHEELLYKMQNTTLCWAHIDHAFNHVKFCKSMMLHIPWIQISLMLYYVVLHFSKAADVLTILSIISAHFQVKQWKSTQDLPMFWNICYVLLLCNMLQNLT
jgi:hypothetical protein